MTILIESYSKDELKNQQKQTNYLLLVNVAKLKYLQCMKVEAKSTRVLALAYHIEF